MNVLKKRWREMILGVLLFAIVSVWILVFEHRQTDLLHIYYLPVGKGSAILIDSPTHARVLIDGGPDASVLSDLGHILPFGDRRIDAVAESNSSAASITGLVSVLKEYNVGAFLEPANISTSYAETILAEEIQTLHIKNISVKPGTTVDLGGGARLQFIFSKSEIAHIAYGTQTISLTSTSTQKTIEIETDGKTLEIK